MPQIFEKDCKLKVIEYGAVDSGADFIEEIKDALQSCMQKITG